ncbi:MAG: FtsX-like permease family protein, partial [Tannerellaceae bacterium]|nr:FtsX-like permease family protein [Tannerellaceae bacterium]
SMFALIGIEALYSLMPVSSIHSGDPTVKKTIWILTLLAFSLLVVAAMNYVLISISSLVKRAKAIGVHKCNGASSANIFTQFIYETAILVGIAFLFSLVLIGVFREPIQTLLQLPVTRIFSLSNLYVTIFVISTILLTAGFIPGWIFSSIPVTQVFRTYTITNRYWKRLLLFVQFGEIAFIVSLLWIIVKQYEMILHKDMGYTVENVVYTVGAENISGEQFALLKQEFERIPQVLHASLTERLPVEEMGGFPVMDENGEHMLFSARQMWADRDYPEAFGINLKMGTTFPENAEHLYVLVNESFVNAMQWKESPVGKGFSISGMEVQVAGVVNNYQLLSFYAQRAAMLQDIPPLIIFSLHPVWHTGSGNKKLVLRLQDTDLSLLSTLNNKLRELLNSEEVYFMDYQTRIVYSYKEARLFRNSILVAAIVMLVIAILGIIGYVQDEMNRRSKEIGIRKINGATATDILVAISKDIVAISIPSLLVGIAVAYFAGQQWLLQFAEKIPLNGILFATSGGFVLLVILLCVVLRAWNTANENPVYSIKAE